MLFKEQSVLSVNIYIHCVAECCSALMPGSTIAYRLVWHDRASCGSRWFDGCYDEQRGCWLSTFRANLSPSPSRVEESCLVRWTRKNTTAFKWPFEVNFLQNSKCKYVCQIHLASNVNRMCLAECSKKLTCLLPTFPPVQQICWWPNLIEFRKCEISVYSLTRRWREMFSVISDCFVQPFGTFRANCGILRNAGRQEGRLCCIGVPSKCGLTFVCITNTLRLVASWRPAERRDLQRTQPKWASTVLMCVWRTGGK